jgi:hypothetical protein
MQLGGRIHFELTFNAEKRKYNFPKNKFRQVLWFMPEISALGVLWKEDCKFEASLDFITRPCLKKTNQNNPKQNKTKQNKSNSNCIHHSIIRESI